MTSIERTSVRIQSQYRIPEHLHEWLKQEAAAQNRSMNAQLIQLIQDSKNRASKGFFGK